MYISSVRCDELTAFCCLLPLELTVVSEPSDQFQLSFLSSRLLWMLNRGHMPLGCATALNSLKLWFDLQLRALFSS